MYEEFFSRRLAQLRAQKGVSAREMSLAIGQNSSYINRIENQRAFPSMQGFFYICEYLGVTPGAFFADPMTHQDYMRQALALAQEAAAAGEVPVGCVIVDKDGQVIGRGRNRREEEKNPLAHAELDAIADACRRYGDWRLKGARLYVTLEPCPMCAGGIISARIPEIYYGAKDAGFGACGSILNLFEEDFRHHPKIVGHILEAECAALLRDFFAQVREKEMQT